jgi:hypothetical protein
MSPVMSQGTRRSQLQADSLRKAPMESRVVMHRTPIAIDCSDTR